MDITLKQRLTGAVVLVALGVIFIPLLLDGAGMEEYRRLRHEMPERPRYEFPVQVQGLPDRTIESKFVSQQDAAAPAKGDSDQRTGSVPQRARGRRDVRPPETDAPADRRIPAQSEKKAADTRSAYAIQLASFSDKGNALILRDRLRKAGHASYLEAHMVSGRRYWRVKVGPLPNRQEAETLRRSLGKRFRLEGSIVRWRPGAER